MKGKREKRQSGDRLIYIGMSHTLCKVFLLHRMSMGEIQIQHQIIIILEKKTSLKRNDRSLKKTYP